MWSGDKPKRKRDDQDGPPPPNRWPQIALVILAVVFVMISLMRSPGLSEQDVAQRVTRTLQAEFLRLTAVAQAQITATLPATPTFRPTLTPQPSDTPPPTPTPPATPVPSAIPLPRPREAITLDNASRLTRIVHDHQPFIGDLTWLEGSHRLVALVSGGLVIYDADQPGQPPEEIQFSNLTSNQVFAISGDQVAVSGASTVTLFDLHSGQKTGELGPHFGDVGAVAFSPDGGLLASGAEDNRVRLWDMTSLTQMGLLEGHTDAVTSVAFSPDGRWLVSTSVDGTVRVWDVASASLIETYDRHDNIVLTAAFDPHSQRIASAGGADIRLWTLDGQTQWRIDNAHGPLGLLNSVAFSPDGTLLASAGYDSQVRLWNVENGERVAELPPLYGMALKVVFSPDGTLLAAMDIEGNQFIWAL